MKGDEMIKSKKIALAVTLITIVIPAIAQAAGGSFELNVNDSDVEARLGVQINPITTPITIGGGFLYSDDDKFWQTYLDLAIKDEVFTPGLNLGLGFKGLFGEAEFVPKDLGIRALAFEFLSEYDLRETTLDFPISFSANIGWAPDVLSFGDTKEYFEFYFNTYLHINYWASIYVGYRDIQIDFEDGGSRFERKSDAFYIGVKLSF